MFWARYAEHTYNEGFLKVGYEHDGRPLIL